MCVYRTEPANPDCGIQFMIGDPLNNDTWGCESTTFNDGLVSQALNNVTFTKYDATMREWPGCLGILPCKQFFYSFFYYLKYLIFSCLAMVAFPADSTGGSDTEITNI